MYSFYQFIDKSYISYNLKYNEKFSKSLIIADNSDR